MLQQGMVKILSCNSGNFLYKPIFVSLGHFGHFTSLVFIFSYILAPKEVGGEGFAIFKSFPAITKPRREGKSPGKPSDDCCM